MDWLSVNWWAVVVCILVSMITGSLWYNPKTFFPTWWQAVGKQEKVPGTKGNMPLIWVLTVASSFVQAYFLAIFINVLGNTLGGVTVVTGVETGFVLWLGFVAPTFLVNKVFAGHGLKIWAIEAGNHLVNFLIFGIIFAVWR